MKTYSIYCKIDGTSWSETIEADYFGVSSAGTFTLKNNVTGEEWYFPIYRTVIKVIKNGTK